MGPYQIIGVWIDYCTLLCVSEYWAVPDAAHCTTLPSLVLNLYFSVFSYSSTLLTVSVVALWD
jgi:hypothetical protein